jgi:hypothetical protein
MLPKSTKTKLSAIKIDSYIIRIVYVAVSVQERALIGKKLCILDQFAVELSVRMRRINFLGQFFVNVVIGITENHDLFYQILSCYFSVANLQFLRLTFENKILSKITWSEPEESGSFSRLTFCQQATRLSKLNDNM